MASGHGIDGYGSEDFGGVSEYEEITPANTSCLRRPDVGVCPAPPAVLPALVETFEPAHIIVADPNWAYRNFSEKKHGAASAHYRTDPIDVMKSLNPGQYAHPDWSVLAMWCVFPHLDRGIDLIRAWDYKFVTGLFWVKTVPEIVEIDLTAIIQEALSEFYRNPVKASARLVKQIVAKIVVKVRRGIGFWTQSAAEFVLLAERGKVVRRDGTTREDTPLGFLHGENMQFWHPIGKHSKKPEQIQDWLEKKFEGPYVELYATRERPRWQCFGYDVGFKITPDGIVKMTDVERLAHAAEKVRREEEQIAKREAKKHAGVAQGGQTDGACANGGAAGVEQRDAVSPQDVGENPTPSSKRKAAGAVPVEEHSAPAVSGARGDAGISGGVTQAQTALQPAPAAPTRARSPW